MGRTRQYTPEQLDVLRIGYRIWNVRDLTQFFNVRFGAQRTEMQIKGVLKHHEIRCGREPKDRLMTRTRLFTQEQIAFMRRNYRGRTVEGLTDRFNSRFGTAVTAQQIKSAVRNRGITCGRTGQFEKGQLPWNAGTKGQGLTGANKGSFKKGNIPPYRRPLGAERIDSKDGKVLVKIAERDPYTGFPTRFKAKHVVLWESAHGPVPKGFAVAFKDGDRCELDNLMLVSRAELLELNSRRIRYKETPPELKPSALALAKLRVKAWKIGHEMARKEGEV